MSIPSAFRASCPSLAGGSRVSHPKASLALQDWEHVRGNPEGLPKGENPLGEDSSLKLKSPSTALHQLAPFAALLSLCLKNPLPRVRREVGNNVRFRGLVIQVTDDALSDHRRNWEASLPSLTLDIRGLEDELSLIEVSTKDPDFVRA